MKKGFPMLALLFLLPIGQLPAAITVTFNGSGRLSVSTTEGETCVISVDSGFVKVNGADPDSGSLMADAVRELNFDGDDASNMIDLSAITAASFPNFTQATINARGGDDTLLCSDFRNTVNMGAGSDSVSNFGSGFTLYDWSPGDGTESIVNDGTDVRLRYQGSTGADQISLSSPGENVLQLTATVLAESITFENLTDLALQLGDGNDVVNASDLSSVNWESPILCNKSGDSLEYNGQDSNQAANFSINGASTQISVTPNSGCSFSQNSLFSAAPFEFSVTKSGDAVRIAYEFNSSEVVHLLSGLSTIGISGTPNDDTFTIENVGSESLETLQLNGRDGSDTVNAVFQTSTTLVFSELSLHQGSDTLTVDAEDKPVLQTASTLETTEGFGNIEFTNVEDIVILNALDPFAELWLVN